MSLVPAKFDHLWAELPQHYEFKKIPTGKTDPLTGKPTRPTLKACPKIPMEVNVDWETCCIQMSYALNQVGLKVKPKLVDMRDANGNQYMLRVPDMRVYLDGEYGTATNIKRVSDDTNKTPIPRWLLMNMMSEERGIIAFGNRHIDMWDGTKIHGINYIPEALWEDESTLALGVFIWTLQ